MEKQEAEAAMAGKDTEVAVGTAGVDPRAVTGTGMLTAMHAVMTTMHTGRVLPGLPEETTETATAEMPADTITIETANVTLTEAAMSSSRAVGIEVPEQPHHLLKMMAQTTCHRSSISPAAALLRLMDACFHVQTQWQGRLPLTHM